jgi:hypothetical protein
MAFSSDASRYAPPINSWWTVPDSEFKEEQDKAQRRMSRAGHSRIRVTEGTPVDDPKPPLKGTEKPE